MPSDLTAISILLAVLKGTSALYADAAGNTIATQTPLMQSTDGQIHLHSSNPRELSFRHSGDLHILCRAFEIRMAKISLH